MKGQRVGYVRVSSADQNADRQLDGVQLDKLFVDKVSGKDVNRPQLQRMLEFVREDDLVVVHSMDRLARNLDDLRRTVNGLTARGVKVQFLKENVVFTGDDSPMSHLLLSLLGAVAEFERALIKERQLDGILLAKKKGIYKGRKKALDHEQIAMLKLRVAGGAKKSDLAKEFGISRETVYQYLR